MFYENGRKRINNKIQPYLTPLALAIWISDDGCWVKHGVRISCNSCTLNEVKLLVCILNKNFGLVCTIQKIYIKDKYSIYIRSQSMLLLRKIISPYLHSSAVGRCIIIFNLYYLIVYINIILGKTKFVFEQHK